MNAPIRVLYDHQVFTWQKYGGISRYYADLLAYRSAAADVVPEISLLYSDNAYLDDVPALRGRVRPKQECPMPWKARLRRRYRQQYDAAARNQQNTLELLEKGAFDIFHPTYYEPYFLDRLGGKPFVVTVYDLLHELYPEFYLTDTRVREKERIVQAAARVIAISGSAKNDLVKVYGIAADKIDVVHLSCAFSPQSCRPADLQLPEKFLLYVGDRGKYKNCYFMMRALRQIILKTPGLHLLCAGGGEFDPVEREYIATLGLTGRVIQHEASTPSLVALYQRAIALLFPSLYEGFGLPITEAFNCGCPVVSSRAPALVEVAGEAALYFNGKDISSLREAVERILTEPDLRAELREKGSRRAQAFSPETCVRETAAVYARVLNRSPAVV